MSTPYTPKTLLAGSAPAFLQIRLIHLIHVFPSFGPQFNGIFNLTFRDILYIKGWPLLGIKLSSGFPPMRTGACPFMIIT
jgi:hypothetical protein